MAWRDMRDFDPYAPAEGILCGLVIALAIWVIIGAIVAAIVFL